VNRRDTAKSEDIMDATFAKSDRPENPVIGRFVVLWGLFFLISFGLGYPTLNRYDPRKLGPDWQSYYNTVTGQDSPDDIPFCFRVLVPYVAKPFYHLAKGRSRTWDPVCFGLLISNCLFSASAAFVIFKPGPSAVQEPASGSFRVVALSPEFRCG